VSAFTWLAGAAVALSLAGHLWAEARGWPRVRAILKLAASASFVLLGASRAQGRYGLLVLTGLVLSAVGDAFLLGRAKGAFLAGVGSFLGAHLAYALAFAPRARSSALIAVLVCAATAGVVAWLWTRLGALRVPVLAYAAAISAMLVLGLGVEDPRVRWGALLFYLSDLAVARDRFDRPGLANALVGLPLYYAAQVLLALSAGAG
jgi:uncharacterized membrane protein YhhN